MVKEIIKAKNPGKYIINPFTNRFVLKNSKKGKDIIKMKVVTLNVVGDKIICICNICMTENNGVYKCSICTLHLCENCIKTWYKTNPIFKCPQCFNINSFKLEYLIDRNKVNLIEQRNLEAKIKARELCNKENNILLLKLFKLFSIPCLLVLVLIIIKRYSKK